MSKKKLLKNTMSFAKSSAQLLLIAGKLFLDHQKKKKGRQHDGKTRY